jgi:D-3-phosphoglycerate dehydrogenase
MAASPHRVLFYTLSGDTGPAQSILDEWGVAEQIELVGVRHDVLVPVTTGAARELARGCEAVVNEFAGLDAAGADALAASGVRLLASLSIGINHFDVDALTRAGVLLTNCPGYCADDVALHAVALMLDLMRKVTASNIDVRAGRWNPYFGYPVHRPAGRTLGLVFFGRIARKVAPIAQALGMRVVVWAPTKSAEELADAGCEKIDTLDELLVRSDVVSLHCPLISLTENLIGARELALMGPDAFLVNTARGGCVDEEALLEALEKGTIRACGLDCLTNERELTATERAIVAHPNAIVTPHSAYVSEEASDALLRMGLQSVRELLIEGRTPTFALNAEKNAR